MLILIKDILILDMTMKVIFILGVMKQNCFLIKMGQLSRQIHNQ